MRIPTPTRAIARFATASLVLPAAALLAACGSMPGSGGMAFSQASRTSRSR